MHGKWKGFKKLLVSTDTTPGVDKSPMQEEYKSALEGDDDVNKKIVKLGELNGLAYEDLILSINTSSSVGKVAFGLEKNAKSVLNTKMLGLKIEPMGNSNKAWEIVCFSYSNYAGDLVSR